MESENPKSSECSGSIATDQTEKMKLQDENIVSVESDVTSNRNSVTTSEVILRPQHAIERKRIVSAVVALSGPNPNFRRTHSALGLGSSKVLGNERNKNGKMILKLVLPEDHLNGIENDFSTTNPADDIAGTLGNSHSSVRSQQQPSSICSKQDYATPINHTFSTGDYEYGSAKTPGGFSFVGSPESSICVPDDPTPSDEKRRAFTDLLTKTLSLFYALFNITVGLAVSVADIVGTSRIAEIFSLCLVIVAAIYIIFLTVDISIFMNRKRKYEDLIEKNMPEQVEMTKTTDGRFQFNIVLPEIIKEGKTIKHNYCFNKDRHSTNFYLKIGAAAFCFGHLIHSGLILGYQIVFLAADDKIFYECASLSTLILDFVYPFYSFILLFFIFKYSNVIINRHIILARFGVMHCLSSSICFWVWTIFREVLEALAAKSQNHKHETEEKDEDENSFMSAALLEPGNNRTGSPLFFQSSNMSLRRFTMICDYQDENMKSIYVDISPYLYPFSVEYSILVVGVLYLVWQNIGMCNVENENEASTSQCRTPAGNSENTEGNVVVHVDCQSSNKGLFGGFAVLVVTIVCCILFFVAVYLDKGKKTEMGLMINSSASLVILATMIFACIIGYRQITKLDLNSSHHNLLDDVLLFICIPAFFLNGIFSIIPAIINGNVLGYVGLIVESFQVLSQTVFILDGLRRSSNTRKLRKNKPGRELVTFLVISNIALWLMETFEVKAYWLKDQRYEFYGKELWTILGHTCLPLMMFYRFHSSVCFGDIWKYAYERSGH
ncbi:proton channel OtopLc isoform X1 [Leptinotarsa decemlineata]|uniref:proton channel OtopLc isoform X1 n=1 Tax=Leptinotarsa decemlineata TaxID=7539 RepID=UPI003D30400D